MKQFLLATSVLLCAGTAQADDLTLQLKWLHSAQFAGYYIAEDMGYYDEEGLDVTILPGGSDIAPTQVLARGAADIIVEWMPAALAAREKGLPLVNIAQPFASSGLSLTCLKISGITDPETDFAGKAFGVWFGGNEYPFLNWMSKLGLTPDDITLLPQDEGVKLLLSKQAACIQTMNYNEYFQLLDAGLTPDDLTVFDYAEHAAATLEDGVYVLESTLEDRSADLKKFVRASIKGWKYAQTNPNEAAEIVLKYDKTGPQDLTEQTNRLKEVTKLIGPNGAVNPADYQSTVETLLSGDSYQVITTAPNGAWTRAITDKAALKEPPAN